MAHTSTYLNFTHQAEEAFLFYRSVFGGEFEGEIYRMGGIPATEGFPPIPEDEKNLVMFICLPILGGHKLCGSDVPESSGVRVEHGNSTYIMLAPDSRAEADRLFQGLSEGGKIEMSMQDAFWGEYFGSFTDKYGIRWMIHTEAKA